MPYMTNRKARGSVYRHFRAVLVPDAVCLDNLRPQQAGGTKFGYLHEIIAAYPEIEFDASRGFVCRETRIGKPCHILRTPCKSITQFL